MAVAGSSLIKGVELIANKFENKDEGAEEETKDKPTEEQEKIEIEDNVSSKEILNFNNEGPIQFNLKTTEAIKNNWKEKYCHDPKLKESFARAYREMGHWRPYLEKIFMEKGMPKELIFLAIPESHWQPQAVSKAGAAGPYQFMPKTAKMYNLKVSIDYDERKDPLASARACADLLADLYKTTKDWNLALSGYNGGFIWEYLGTAKAGKAEVSYENFLKFVENKLNLAKNEVKGMNSQARIVKRGESLSVIAAEYGLSSAELADYNKISNPEDIKAGQKLAVPLRQEKKEAIFNKKISGFSENLNYPAKYYAIMELIKEGLVKEQAGPIIFEIKEVKRSASGYNFYTAKAGDRNLFRIAKKLKINYKELVKFNPLAVKNLRAGLEIKIPSVKSRLITLADVARQTNKPMARLEFLNPAIKKNAPIIAKQIRI